MASKSFPSPLLLTGCFPVVLLLLFPAYSNAEIYQCDGKWTNVPCGQQTTQNSGKKNTASENDSVPEATEPTAAKPEQHSDPVLERQREQWAVKEKEQQALERERLKGASSFASSLSSMNSACKFYTGSEIKSFEAFCRRRDTALENCRSRWNEMHSKMLAASKDDKCRSVIFSLTGSD